MQFIMFITNSHELHSEIGGFSIPKTPWDEGICHLCHSKRVDYETHAIPLLYLLCVLWLCLLLLLAQLLFFPELLPHLMKLLLFFFHSLLIPLTSWNSLVILMPLCLNSHSFLFYKWIYVKLVAFLLLHVVGNLPLPFVTQKYAWLWCLYCCYC